VNIQRQMQRFVHVRRISIFNVFWISKHRTSNITSDLTFLTEDIVLRETTRLTSIKLQFTSKLDEPW